MTTDTVAGADTGVVRSVFAAFTSRDIAAIGDLFHQDPTWNHPNDDRLGGLHHGSDGIVAFLAESAQLTGGTLRPVPRSFLADGEGRIAVLVQVSGSRPDGPSSDNPQIVLFTPGSGRVRTAGQFVGDPAAVAAFWA